MIEEDLGLHSPHTVNAKHLMSQSQSHPGNGQRPTNNKFSLSSPTLLPSSLHLYNQILYDSVLHFYYPLHRLESICMTFGLLIVDC